MNIRWAFRKLHLNFVLSDMLTPKQHAMGQQYAGGYLKDNILAAIDRVIVVVAEHNINGHAAALRWTIYHSQLRAELGDAVVLPYPNPSTLVARYTVSAPVAAPRQSRSRIADQAQGSQWIVTRSVHVALEVDLCLTSRSRAKI